MLLRSLAAFMLLFATVSNANLFLLNEDSYVEIDFTIRASDNNFDQDVNFLDIWLFYTPESYQKGYFMEEFSFFDDGNLLGVGNLFPGLSANDYNPDGIDFSRIRDGSFKGTLRVRAWYENNPDWNVELTDFFSYTLNVCDGSGCRYSDTSYISFGDVRYETVAVSEPATFGMLSLAGFLLLSKRRRKSAK